MKSTGSTSGGTPSTSPRRGRIKRRDPARAQPQVGRGQDEMIHDDGRVHVGVTLAVVHGPLPRLRPHRADAQDQGRLGEPVPVIDAAQLGFSPLRVNHDDAKRLLVRRGRRQPAGLQHLRQQFVRHGIGFVGPNAVTTTDEFQVFHDSSI